MKSEYVIRVVHERSGRVVEWAPGMPVERRLVDDVCDRVAARGVGVGRGTAHVVRDVRAALEESLHELKSEVRP